MENKKPSNADAQVPLQGLGVSMFYKSTPVTFANAKALRNEPTQSEIIFWSLLKQNFPRIRFKRQHPISEYIADFYCHKFKLVIEIDGTVHLTTEAKNNDKLRDEYMQSLGLKIIRFTNDEVIKNGELVIQRLRDTIKLIINNQHPEAYSAWKINHIKL